MTIPNIINVHEILGKSNVANLTTTSTAVVVNPVGSNAVFKINTLFVTNVDGVNVGNVTIEHFVAGAQNPSTGIGNTVYNVVSNLSVPANSFFDLLNKSLYLQEGDQLKAVSTANNRLHLVTSFEEIVTYNTEMGGIRYVNPGTYTWTVPNGVDSVSVVAVGGGGGGARGAQPSGQAITGGGGGGLAYINNFPVAPGQTYTVVVGAGGTRGALSAGGVGGNSYFKSVTECFAEGGKGSRGVSEGGKGGGFIVSIGASNGGANGGAGGNSTQNFRSSGGGGAAGYIGDGGKGGDTPSVGTAGTGGAGGGGAGGGTGNPSGSGGGGGVGLFGQLFDGVGGIQVPSSILGGGQGGSRGTAGGGYTLEQFAIGGDGGLFGGGGGGVSSNYGSETAGSGGGGAVRIIWPGTIRQFPITRVWNTSEEEEI